MTLKKYFSCGRFKFIPGERTIIMGILNITPDSFSDGGLYHKPKLAIANAERMLKEGADIIDVGGVSTAPRARPVSIEEELDRVLPVITGLVREGINNISVDTSRALVAKRALDLGASWINDQHSGLLDPEMPAVLSQAEGCVLMHNKGESGVSAGESIVYSQVVTEVCNFFSERLNTLVNLGMSQDRIIIDPGIGFGKGLKDSLLLINNMQALNSLGVLTCLGVSRKSFLAPLTGVAEPVSRDFASLGAIAAGIASGAHIIRTHNIKAAFDFTRVFNACTKNA